MRTAARRAPSLNVLSSRLLLSDIELAHLFGVTRRTIANWQVRGVPARRRSAVQQVQGLVETLERRIDRARLPSVVRTADADLGGKTILSVIAEQGVEPVYEYLERLFAYPLE